MDVTGIQQNKINVNQYSSNSEEYLETNTEITIQKVQNVENKVLAQNETKKEEYSKKDMDKALKKLNNFLKDERTHAEYSLHKDFGTVMIKIINEDTNQVILEIPPKKILDMIASMCRQVGILDKKA